MLPLIVFVFLILRSTPFDFFIFFFTFHGTPQEMF